MSTLLGVFAKYWQPGTVKTRLAKSIGPTRSSELYRYFVEATLRRYDQIAQRRLLVFSPPSYREAFQELAGPNWELKEQTGGDLGQRIAAYFHEALPAAPDGALLIGTDSPSLPVDFVLQAFRNLHQKNSVVLGPSSDGGYYLIGMKEPLPQVLDGIPWSTSQVFARTVDALERLHINYAILPEWYDVDEIDDLRRLGQELRVAENRDVFLDDLSTRIDDVLVG